MFTDKRKRITKAHSRSRYYDNLSSTPCRIRLNTSCPTIKHTCRGSNGTNSGTGPTNGNIGSSRENTGASLLPKGIDYDRVLFMFGRCRDGM